MRSGLAPINFQFSALNKNSHIGGKFGMRNLCCSLINLLLLVSLIQSCAPASEEVVIYVTVDQVYAEPVLRDFEKETGIRVKEVFDTEETKSTGILNRLIAEKDNPKCDVFWSGDPVRTEVLKSRNILAANAPENAKDIPATFKDKDGYWVGFSVRSRVLIYNKNLMTKEQAPQSVFDLAKEEFRGRVAIANPLFGTTTFHVASWFEALGDEQAQAFMDSLKKNDVVLLSSNGDVKRRVSKGEIPCGLTDTDDVFVAILAGEPVDMIFLDQDSLGSLIMPNTVSLIANSPDPDNGKKLIEYLLTKETESKLAHSCAQIPLRAGVNTPEFVPTMEDIRPMLIDYSVTAKKLEAIQPFIKNWIENW
jgi:iron(III) transport system substrate-binding protein